MENKRIIIGSLLVAIGVTLCGLFIGWGIRSMKTLDRTVTVRGLSEIERPADHVIWPISYTVTGNDLVSMFTQVEQKNQTIMAFLTQNGLTQNEIAIGAPSVTDTQAERYGGNNNSPFRYFLTQVVTVSSAHVDIVRNLMVKQTQLLKANIAVTTENWQYQTKFLFNNLDSVKPMMIEQATKNARKSAQKFAEDSESKLGKIKRASQGQLTIENRDDNTPYIKTLRVVTTVEYMLED